MIGVLEELRGTMIAVATGGPRIADVNERYQQAFAALETELAERDIDNPIRYRDLWDWYGRWSTGDLPSYQSRRTFVSELVNPLIGRIRAGYAEEAQPTGWARVDRTVDELRNRLAASRNEGSPQTGVGGLRSMGATGSSYGTVGLSTRCARSPLRCDPVG